MKESPARPWVLGVSSGFHNGAACLLKGDEIVVAMQEERLSRIKRDSIRINEPSLAVQYCLDAVGIGVSQLDLIVDCTISLPAGSRPDDVLPGSLLHDAGDKVEILSIPHHFGHAVSAFATSGFRDSAVLVIDGGGSFGWQLPAGERRSALACDDSMCEHISIYLATEDGVEPVEKHMSFMPYLWESGRRRMRRFASLGHMYSSAALQIFGDYLEAGKVMGLAPYVQPSIPVSEFFEYDAGVFRFSDRILERFGYAETWSARKEEYQDLAASVQRALEYALSEVVMKIEGMCLSRQLCYAGGVALNSVANHKVFRHASFADVHIIPAAEDNGVAIGAAYHGLSVLIGKYRSRRLRSDCLGRDYPENEIRGAIEMMPGVSSARSDDVLASVVELLCAGKVVAWFQGGAEFGPRALGNRSILYDPRREDAKRVLNERVKHREPFRPFAPAVLADKVTEWFETETTTSAMRFMLEVCRFKPHLAAQVPGVNHVDGTGRLQCVEYEDNPKFYNLIKTFYSTTGVPIILNTSMNIMGEPIVETPTEAVWLLLSTGVDYCVLGETVVRKEETFRSVLDLVPYSTIHAVANGDGFATVEVETNYGRKRYERVSSKLVRILERVDGETPGRCLFGESVDERQRGCSVLGQLFRYRFISFRHPAPLAARHS
jgi:carbamoyltransferase